MTGVAEVTDVGTGGVGGDVGDAEGAGGGLGTAAVPVAKLYPHTSQNAPGVLTEPHCGHVSADDADEAAGSAGSGEAVREDETAMDPSGTPAMRMPQTSQ